MYRLKKKYQRGRREAAGLCAPPPRGVCLPAMGMCHCLRCFPARKVPAPLGGSTSGPGPASPPARARRPPSYKETSRCRRPSRGAPRLSSRPGSRRSLPAPSAATEVSGGGGAPGSPSVPPGPRPPAEPQQRSVLLPRAERPRRGTRRAGEGDGWALRAPRLFPVWDFLDAVGT